MALPGRRKLRIAIQETGGIIAEVARHLDVSRQTVYRWLEHYQMRPLVKQARENMRTVAQDVVYQRLMNEDEDSAFDAAKFVLLHLKDDGELLGLSPETLRLMATLGIESSIVVRQFEELVRAEAASLSSPSGAHTGAPLQERGDGE